MLCSNNKLNETMNVLEEEEDEEEIGHGDEDYQNEQQQMVCFKLTYVGLKHSPVNCLIKF